MTISKKYKNSNIKILQSAFDDVSVSESLVSAGIVKDTNTKWGTPTLLDRGGLSKTPTQSGGNYVNNNIHTDATRVGIVEDTNTKRGKKTQAIRVKKKIPLIDTTKLLTQ